MSPRPPSHFCRAIERLAAPAAVRAEWRDELGEDWPWASALLRGTDRLAGCYPKRDGTRRAEGPPYAVVWRDEAADLYIASCPWGTGKIELGRADLVIYELDLPALCRRMADALGLTFDFDEHIAGAPHVYRVGAKDPMQEQESWVYLCLAPDAAMVSNAFAQLGSRHERPFLLFTCTRSNWCGPVGSQAGGTLRSLEDSFLVSPAGEWHAVIKAGDSVSTPGGLAATQIPKYLPNRNDLAVLKVLASKKQRMFPEDIAAATDATNHSLSRRTVGNCLKVLAEHGHVDYPPKRRMGAAITPSGFMALAAAGPVCH